MAYFFVDSLHSREQCPLLSTKRTQGEDPVNGIGILKTGMFFLAFITITAIAISANAEDRSLSSIRKYASPGLGFIAASEDGMFEKLAVIDEFYVQGMTDKETGAKKIELIVSDGSKSFINCFNEEKTPKNPLGDTRTTIQYRPIPGSNHLEFSVEYTIESPYSGKARKHIFKMPINGAYSISLGDGVTVEKNDEWITYTQIGGVIGPRNASKMEFQFPTEGAALQQGYVVIGSSAWEYAVDSKAKKGVVNGEEVFLLGARGGRAIRPVQLDESSLKMQTKHQPSISRGMKFDARLSTYETSSNQLACPIGTCWGRERVSCTVMGISVINCWCPDGFSCVFRY